MRFVKCIDGVWLNVDRVHSLGVVESIEKGEPGQSREKIFYEVHAATERSSRPFVLHRDLSLLSAEKVLQSLIDKISDR